MIYDLQSEPDLLHFKELQKQVGVQLIHVEPASVVVATAALQPRVCNCLVECAFCCSVVHRIHGEEVQLKKSLGNLCPERITCCATQSCEKRYFLGLVCILKTGV